MFVLKSSIFLRNYLGLQLHLEVAEDSQVQLWKDECIIFDLLWGAPHSGSSLDHELIWAIEWFNSEEDRSVLNYVSFKGLREASAFTFQLKFHWFWSRKMIKAKTEPSTWTAFASIFPIFSFALKIQRTFHCA